MRPRKWYSIRWSVVVVALGAGGLAWYLAAGRYQHPVGAGPAGSPVPIEPFQQVWSPEPVVLLGLGDSVTDGFGASHGRSYFDLLVKNDDAACPDMRGRDLSHVFPRLTPDNRSISATTSAEHLAGQVGTLKPYGKEVRGVVVITSGGNDLIHNYGQSPPRDGAAYGCTYDQALEWKERFRERLAGILDGAEKAFPGGCDLFVATIYDPTDGVGDIEHAHLLLPRWPDGLKTLTAFNQVIAEVVAGRPNAHLVDVHAAMLGHGIHCGDRRSPSYCASDPHYWYFQNLEDPNDRGYDAIRRAFLLKMAEVLAPGG